jgi:hypothetical protein
MSRPSGAPGPIQPADLRVLPRLILLQTRARLLLHLLPPDAFAAAALGPRRSRRSLHAAAADVARIGRITDWWMRRTRVGRAPCTLRAWCRMRLLRDEGLAASYCSGVRSGQDLDAHAWVEVDGHALFEPTPVDGWSVLLRLPPTPNVPR